jgi:hypothetical protein|tara:strand:+ start:235 stop:504 length:270 start_codon:yes stop_codon:yes gene_type:complete
MEALIIVLVVVVGYLTFHMKKSDSQDKEFDRLKETLDDALAESPYKIEPIVATKRKTRKRIVKIKRTPIKKVVKKKVVKKKVKTKRKTK